MRIVEVWEVRPCLHTDEYPVCHIPTSEDVADYVRTYIGPYLERQPLDVLKEGAVFQITVKNLPETSLVLDR